MARPRYVLARGLDSAARPHRHGARTLSRRVAQSRHSRCLGRRQRHSGVPGPLPKNFNPRTPWHTAVFLVGLLCLVAFYLPELWPVARCSRRCPLCVLSPSTGQRVACHNRHGGDRNVFPCAGLLLEILAGTEALSLIHILTLP